MGKNFVSIWDTRSDEPSAARPITPSRTKSEVEKRILRLYYFAAYNPIDPDHLLYDNVMMISRSNK